MPFEPSTLYTTVAQCSATIVAILGGFIASKLISISTDREKVKTRVSELESQIAYKLRELNPLLQKKDEVDAHKFIQSHIEEFVQKQKVCDIYDSRKDAYIELEKIDKHWQAATILIDELVFSIEKGITPQAWVTSKTINELKFSVEILKEKKRKNYKNQATDGYIELLKSNLEKIPEDDYHLLNRQIVKLSDEIKWFTFQKDEEINKKRALKKPEGMKNGIIILSLLSIVGIVIPLVFLIADISKIYVSIVVIVLFALCLGSVIFYLANLLNWKD